MIGINIPKSFCSLEALNSK